jgi:preprotein translocase subunit Sec63
MNTEEIMVCVVCALVGYWVISAVIGNTSKPKSGPEDGTAGALHPEGPRKQAWYEVLAVSKNASLEDVQAAYRTLVSQYHPDKVASLGEELRDLAEAKSKAINQAYNEALAAVGSRH